MTRSEVHELLQQHHRAAYGWAVHCCCGDRWDAEGVLHDVYRQLLEGKSEFRGESQPRTWLFSLIRNHAIQRRRRFLRRFQLLQDKLRGFRRRSVPPVADETLERDERRRHLLGLLRQLPSRQQEALHLVFYQELSLRQAAEIMGVSLGTARVHYHRGKTALRRMIEASGVDYGRPWKPADPRTV